MSLAPRALPSAGCISRRAGVLDRSVTCVAGSRVPDSRRDFAWQSMAALSADPRARLEWLTHLLQDGIAFLSEVPATEAGILEAMTQIGRIAETNYGLVFDVRA